MLSLAVAGDSAWAGTALGVAEFSAGKFTRVLAPGLFAESLLARGTTLAVGSLNQGVLEIPLGAVRSHPARSVAEPLPGTVKRLLVVDGALYAVGDRGLYLVDERRGGWRRVLDREAAPLADRNVSALAFDGAGRLWVGYFDRGLDILEPGLDRATHVEDDHVFCVNRIVEDSRRRIMAVATANGLVLFDAGGVQRQVLGRAEGLIANHVTDVAMRPGGMTIATPAGLTFVDAGGVRSLYAFHGLVNNHVYALAGAGDRLLAGTLGGLSVLDGDVVRASYTTANSGLRANWITAIAQAGPEWFVGTYGAGVLRFDASGRWQTFADLRALIGAVKERLALLEGTGQSLSSMMSQTGPTPSRVSAENGMTRASSSSSRCRRMVASALFRSVHLSLSILVATTNVGTCARSSRASISKSLSVGAWRASASKITSRNGGRSDRYAVMASAQFALRVLGTLA